MNWDEYFVKMAELVASKSKDPSVQVGAVVVGPGHEIRSTGYNDFPRGVQDQIPQRRVRPDKYDFTEHAERNAVYNAARVGIPLEGCSMYLNWEPTPCTDCTRAVIQAGLAEVVGPDRPFPRNKDWGFEHAEIMLKEAGVRRRYAVGRS